METRKVETDDAWQSLLANITAKLLSWSNSGFSGQDFWNIHVMGGSQLTPLQFVTSLRYHDSHSHRIISSVKVKHKYNIRYSPLINWTIVKTIRNISSLAIVSSTTQLILLISIRMQHSARTTKSQTSFISSVLPKNFTARHTAVSIQAKCVGAVTESKA